MSQHVKNVFCGLAATAVAGIASFCFVLLSLKTLQDNERSQSRGIEVGIIHSSAPSEDEKHEIDNHQFKMLERLEQVATRFLTDVKITDVLLATFTYLLYVKTAGLERSTTKLWEAGERQIEHVKTSADAAKASADSAVAASRAHVRIERFVLGQGPADVYRSISAQNGLGIYSLKGFWDLKNFGRTPAEIYSVAFNAGYATNINQLIPRLVEARQSRTIGEGETLKGYFGDADAHITTEQKNLIVRGVGHLWFVVDITYIDVFGCVFNETKYYRLVNDVRRGCSIVVSFIDRRSLLDRQV